MEIMDKPIAIKIEEARNNILTSVNNTDLPMCILRPIVQDILNSIIDAERRELIASHNDYDKANNDTKDEP